MLPDLIAQLAWQVNEEGELGEWLSGTSPWNLGGEMESGGNAPNDKCSDISGD